MSERQIFIQPHEIILLYEKRELRNFDDVLRRVVERQHYFLHTLEMLMSYSDVEYPAGWESFRPMPDGSLSKSHSFRRSEYNLFTGKHLCTLASVALAEGINFLVKKYWLPISIEVGEVVGYFNGEDWHRFRPLAGVAHTLPRLIDHQTGKTIYLDPTYSQINHTYTGRIVETLEEDFESRYFLPSHLGRFFPLRKYPYRKSTEEEFAHSAIYQKLTRSFE